ncbi:terpenoid cyclases/protein prenyltransferase alpha-alpha toroid [Lipomyces oligophaga]|uniref:terpenoid cyclases/protein prenyltransferase alpha-alpha toroid n=1 Tax=Lipomyces oligophaga TaxID=45792 RepID=UPI0034CFD5EF
MNDLAVDRHAAYFRYCLNVLPSPYVAVDATRLAMVFFSIAGLDLLGCLPNVDPEIELGKTLSARSKVSEKTAQAWIEWIYSTCMIPGGAMFRASPSIGAESNSNQFRYDVGHIAGTYFALSTLLILRDDLSRIDRKAMLSWLRACQREDGSFASGVFNWKTDKQEQFGERDLRFGYCAAAIRWMIGGDRLVTQEAVEDINVESAITYVVQECWTYDGGLGMGGMSEGHGGFTYCGVGLVKLLDGDLERCFGREKLQQLIRWSVAHQVAEPGEDGASIAGFNGRINKDPDTCYAFWVGGTLDMLGKEWLEKTSLGRWTAYLVETTQNQDIGGFGKTADSMPDVMHSYLGLAALALRAASYADCLKQLDGSLCIAADGREHAEKLRRSWDEQRSR